MTSAQQRAEELSDRIDSSELAQDALTLQGVQEFRTTLEELQVAHEELSVQNEELLERARQSKPRKPSIGISSSLLPTDIWLRISMER